MADNVSITAGSGTVIATDEVGGAQYQRVKIALGADGVAADLAPGQAAMAASVPVAIASNQSAVAVSGTVAVTGVSTAALQGGGLPAALGAGGGLKVDGSGTALPVSGTFYQATQPTSDAGPAWTSVYLHTASADATGIVDVTGAPTSGQKIVIDDIIVSVDTAMAVTFEEETAHTDILKLYLAANSSAQVTPRGKIKLPTADKKLQIDTSAAGNIAVTVVYHSEA